MPPCVALGSYQCVEYTKIEYLQLLRNLGQQIQVVCLPGLCVNNGKHSAELQSSPISNQVVFSSPNYLSAQLHSFAHVAVNSLISMQKPTKLLFLHGMDTYAEFQL